MVFLVQISRICTSCLLPTLLHLTALSSDSVFEVELYQSKFGGVTKQMFTTCSWSMPVIGWVGTLLCLLQDSV